MATTTPFPFRDYHAETTTVLAHLIDDYESALGDADHATEPEAHEYYTGCVDALFRALVSLLEVPTEAVNAYVDTDTRN